jgi:hypothetical protein
MMNIFGFNLNDAIVGLFAFFWAGLAFGMLWLGLIRFLLLSVFERREG